MVLSKKSHANNKNVIFIKKIQLPIFEDIFEEQKAKSVATTQ